MHRCSPVCRQGDEAALRELIDRHRLAADAAPASYAPELAAEALHDTFVAVWRIRVLPRRRRRGCLAVGDRDPAAGHPAAEARAPVPVSSQVISALSPTVRSAEDELLVAVEHGAVGDALRSCHRSSARCCRRR